MNTKQLYDSNGLLLPNSVCYYTLEEIDSQEVRDEIIDRIELNVNVILISNNPSCFFNLSKYDAENSEATFLSILPHSDHGSNIKIILTSNSLTLTSDTLSSYVSSSITSSLPTITLANIYNGNTTRGAATGSLIANNCKYKIVNNTSTAPSLSLTCNTHYKFTSNVNSVTITGLTAPSSSSTAYYGTQYIYSFEFTCASNNTTLTVPSTVKLGCDAIPFKQGRRFIVTIMNNVMLYTYVD